MQKFSTQDALTGLFKHFDFSLSVRLDDAFSRNAEYYLWMGRMAPDIAGDFWYPNLLLGSALPEILPVVSKSLRKKGRTLGKGAIQKAIQNWGTGLKAKYVDKCCFSFGEIDHLPLADQLEKIAWLEKETGVKFSMLVSSGGKSVHFYFLFDKPIQVPEDLDQWQRIQDTLIVLMSSDATIRDLTRKMRLPGGTRNNPGDQKILRLTPTPYAPEFLEEKLTELLNRMGWNLKDGMAALGEAAKLRRVSDPDLRSDCLALAEKITDQRYMSEHDGKLAKILTPIAQKPLTEKSSKGGKARTSTYGPETIVNLKDGDTSKLSDFLKDGEHDDRVFCPRCMSKTLSGVLLKEKSKRPVIWCYSCKSIVASGLQGLIEKPLDAPPAIPQSPYLTVNWDAATDPVVILAADTGTGKTTSLGRLVEKYKREGKRILCIVHRQTLAMALSRILGLDNYLDQDIGPLTSDHLVVCINSLGRVPLYAGAPADWLDGAEGFDLVILEESESVFNALTGDLLPVVQSKNGGIWDSGGIHTHLSTLVCDAVKSGGQVVASDGFALGPFSLTSRCLSYLGLKQEPKVFEKRSDQSNVTLTEHPSRGGAIARIIQLAADGKRVAVACTKAEWVRLLALHLEQQGIDVLAIHADSDAEVFKTLANVEESWKTPQVLIYSPSVDTGVSYNPKDEAHKFDHLFVLGYPVMGLGVNKIHQMRHRIREMKSIHWWIPENYSHELSFDLDEIKNAQLVRWHSACKTAIKFHSKDGKIVPIQDEGHFAHAALAQSSRLRRWARVRLDWIEWWVARGASLETHQPLSETSEKAVSALLKELRQVDRETFTQEVMDAQLMSGVEYRDKKKSPSRDKTLRRSLEKGRHFDTYGQLDGELVPKDRHRRVYAKVRQATNNLLVALGRDDAASKFDTLTVESGKRAHARTYYSSSKIQYACLKKAFGGQNTQLIFETLQRGVTMENHSINGVGPQGPQRSLSLSNVGCGPKSDSPLLLTWTAGAWVGEDLFKKLATDHGWEKVGPLLQGSGISQKSFEVPTKLVGEILKGMGISPKVKRLKAAGGKRVRQYIIDQEVLNETVSLIRRTARKSLGLHIIDFDVLTGQIATPTFEDNVSLESIIDEIFS